MAVGDIVPVPGDSFEQTLASASPDMLREMIREFAQRMMDAEVEVRVQRGLRGGDAGPGQLPQRLPARGSGTPGPGRWSWRSPSCGTGRTSRRSWSTGAAPSGRWPRSWRRQLPAGRLDPAGGEARRLPGRHGPVQVAGQRDGRRAGRARGKLPEPAAGWRAVHLRVDRRADAEGPRGRPHGERALPDRDRRERRRVPGDPRHRRDQLRGRRGLAGVPALPGRPRPVRRRAGDQRRPRRAGERHRRRAARRRVAALPDALPSQPAHPGAQDRPAVGIDAGPDHLRAA